MMAARGGTYKDYAKRLKETSGRPTSKMYAGGAKNRGLAPRLKKKELHVIEAGVGGGRRLIAEGVRGLAKKATKKATTRSRAAKKSLVKPRGKAARAQQKQVNRKMDRAIDRRSKTKPASPEGRRAEAVVDRLAREAGHRKPKPVTDRGPGLKPTQRTTPDKTVGEPRPATGGRPAYADKGAKRTRVAPTPSGSRLYEPGVRSAGAKAKSNYGRVVKTGKPGKPVRSPTRRSKSGPGKLVISTKLKNPPRRGAGNRVASDKTRSARYKGEMVVSSGKPSGIPGGKAKAAARAKAAKRKTSMRREASERKRLDDERFRSGRLMEREWDQIR